MKNKIKKILLISLMTVSLCGCSSSTKKNSNLLIVTDKINNFQMHDYKNSTEHIDQVLSHGGHLSILSAEGKPNFYFDSDVKKIDTSYGSTKINNIKKQDQDKIISIIQKTDPSTNQIDLIETLNFISNWGSSYKKEDCKVDLYLSGISTEGALDFSKVSSLENIDIVKTIENLNSNGVLPKFDKNIHMYFHDLGYIASATDKRYLKNFLLELLKACGLNNSQIKFQNNVNANNETYKLKTRVTTSFLKEKDENNVVSAENIDLKNSYLEINTKFKKNSIEILNQETLNTQLQELRKYLEKNHDNITIIGSTANDGSSQENLKELAYDRAVALKKIITNKGIISDERITCIGVGSSSPFHKNEWEDGGFNENVAATNRNCIIVSDNNKEILSKFIDIDYVRE